MSAERVATADAVAVFAALGDQTRLRIVARLCRTGPGSIARLTEGTSVTRQAVTKHLRVLEEAGLVRSHRVGREVIWSVQQRRLERLGRHLAQCAAQSERTRRRLKGGREA